jgi:hypothetical protein
VVDDSPATLEYIQSLLAFEPYCIEPPTKPEHAVEVPNIGSKALLYKLKQYETAPVLEEVVARSAAGMRTAHA